MPTLLKHENGVFYFVARVNGKQKWISLRTKDKKVGRARYAEMADQFDRGILDLAQKKPVPTMQQLFDEYLPFCRQHKKPRTYRDAECHIRLFLGPFFGPLKATDLESSEIEKFTGELLKMKYHPRTIDLRLETLRKILYRAVENKLIPAMPCKIKMLPVPDSLPRYASPEHIKEWMGHLDAGPRLRAILSLMTGITDRDLGFVRQDGYDRHNALLRFRRPKTVTDIVVPLTPVAMQILDVLVKQSPGPALFLAASAKKAFATASKRTVKAGGKKITPHMLRHSFATWLLSIGVPVEHIQQILGHRDIKTTLRYARVMPGHLRASMSKIEAKEFDIEALISMPKKQVETASSRWTDDRKQAQAERMKGNKLGLKSGKYSGGNQR